MNVILIGFMGSGKDSVAAELEKTLQRKAILMDERVLAQSSRLTIGDIFTRDGEAHFRELEIAVAKELAQKEQEAVIACGGGLVMNQLGLLFLKPTGLVFHLAAPFEVLQERLQGDATRPLFQDEQKARALYQLRQPLYEYYADHQIKAWDRPIAEIAAEIAAITQQHSAK